MNCNEWRQQSRKSLDWTIFLMKESDFLKASFDRTIRPFWSQARTQFHSHCRAWGTRSGLVRVHSKTQHTSSSTFHYLDQVSCSLLTASCCHGNDARNVFKWCAKRLVMNSMPASILNSISTASFLWMSHVLKDDCNRRSRGVWQQ